MDRRNFLKNLGLFVPGTVVATTAAGTNTVVRETKAKRQLFVATVGIEDEWEPTPDEMDQVAQLLLQAIDDPKGGVVVFRRGVKVETFEIS